jgi:hypothetical protein
MFKIKKIPSEQPLTQVLILINEQMRHFGIPWKLLKWKSISIKILSTKPNYISILKTLVVPCQSHGGARLLKVLDFN